ncbi:NCS1 nucleoside transporter family, partial [Hortaea werneckii]
ASRYVWGVYGQYIALLQRLVLSLVWFAVQSWTGGLCVQNVLASIFPSFQHMSNHFPASAKMNTKQFIGWILFNVIMAPLLYVRPEGIKYVVLWSNVISVITLLSMMIWSLSAANGADPLVSAPASATGSSELGWGIVSGVTTTIGSIAVGLTNQMDYSRFARKPGDQVLGQWISIIGFGAIYQSAGAWLLLLHKGYMKWLDTDYSAKSRAAAFFAGCGLVVCQLAINTIDNAFSFGMDFSGLIPSHVNIRRGSYIGLIISIAMCPWQLLSSAATFISVLNAYSVFLGPLTGIMVCEYWVLRQRRVKLTDLYHPRKEGLYHYWYGINWRSFLSWVIGWAYLIPGFAHAVTPHVAVPRACTDLYYLAYPLGFTVSFLTHWALNTMAPPPGLGVADDVDVYETFASDEAMRLGIAPSNVLDAEEVTVDGEKGGNSVRGPKFISSKA